MPNMLAHLGVGGVLTRCVVRQPDVKWTFLGCVIPDIPWILQRLCAALPVELDPYDVRTYFVIQASLAGCLCLGAAFAILSAAPRRVFAILSLNIVAHLLLDACQTKWGNGIHMFAPATWDGWNFGLFWPESVLTYGLTAFGVVYCLYTQVWQRGGAIRFQTVPVGRTIAGLGFLATYALLPVVLFDGAHRSDVHYVRTLREVDSRIGQHVEVDRGHYRQSESREFLETYAGEKIDLAGQTPDQAGLVSIRGNFVDQHTIQLSAFHAHGGGRDFASLVGLAFVSLYWFDTLLSGCLVFFQRCFFRG
jgi:hypothetical protein